MTTMIVSQVSVLVVAVTFFSAQCTPVPHACHVCYCGKKHKVDCSRLNLTEIPMLPKDTQYLIFNGNNLRSLSLSVLLNVPSNIKQMFFGNCKIQTIANENIFKNFTKLTTFAIRSNTFNESSFKNLFKSVQLSNIISLDISGNNMNKISQSLNFSMLDRLKTILMNDCNIISLASIFRTNKKRSFKHMEFKRNLIEEIPVYVFQKYGMYYNKLRLLKLSSNPITKIVPNTFAGLAYLRRLMLSNINAKGSDFKGINCSTLEFLDISNSTSFSFRPPMDYKDVFKLTPNIVTLNISRTDFSNWTKSDLYHLLSPMKKLEALALSKTSLTFIPNTALQSLRKLHTLDISRNSIIDWDPDCFRNMSSTFTKLYLDRNLITIINENSFPSEFLQDLEKLHLYENKFHCNCSIHWFRHWMKDNYGKLDALDYEKHFIYQCSAPPDLNNTLLVDYDPTYEHCNGPSTAEIISITLSSFLFILIITLLVVDKIYKYRKSKDYEELQF